MLTLAKKLGLPDGLIQRLATLDKSKINEAADKCLKVGFHTLRRQSDLMRLGVILELAVRVKEKYLEAGISEEIYFDTMSDIKIWCEHSGNKGLKNYGWLKNHVCFELFRLGRLQFQLYECKNKTLLYKKLPFDYGEKLVYVHIPEGEGLEKEKCRKAFEAADGFFARYFPEHTYRFYFCESWLLYENNRDFMSADSNIIEFMSLFDICYSLKIDEQAIERIFGKRRLFKKSYPEKTSLQRRAKKYMLGGGRLGIGVGVTAKK